MKAITALKKVFQDSPYTGMNVRQKFYAASGTLTSINTNSPNIQYITVPDSEYFWCTGVYGSYFATAAPFTLTDIFVQITNQFTSEQFFRSQGSTARQGYSVFRSVLEPGPISNVPAPSNEKRLEGVLKPDTVFAPQQQIAVSCFGPTTFVNNIRFDVLLIGFAVRLLR